MPEEQQSEVISRIDHLKNVRPPVFKKDFSVKETNAELNRYNSEIDTARVYAQLQRAEDLKPPDDASLGDKLGYSLSFNNQVSVLGKPQVDGEVLQSAKASRETTTTSITPSLKRELTSNISATPDSFFRGAVPETVLNEAVGNVRPEPPSERQLVILASRPEDYSQPSDVSVKRNAVSVKPLDKTTEDEKPPSQQELLSTGVEVPTKNASENVTGGGKKRRKNTKKKKKSKKRKTKRKYKIGKRN